MEYKHINIIVPSYNNSKWYEQNIKSIAEQDYPLDKYKIIYTDDASTDGTANLVEEFISKNNYKNIKLIKNEKRIGALHNLYNMIHSTDDNHICALVDGDDKIIPSALKIINNKYQDANVWATYGSYADSRGMTRGCCKPPDQNIVRTAAYRRVPWYMSHMRTFYTGLFKKIKWEDFLYSDGTPYKMGWDLSIMIPLAELSAEKMQYIHDMIYIYNNDNDISDHKVDQNMQARMDQYIRRKKPYSKLEKL